VRVKVPSPRSGGLILSYRCSCECLHCMYACSPRWKDDWISREDMESILSGLAGRIVPSPYGPDTVSLNHGLHFTGGEPFLNFELLVACAQTAASYGIPSSFVETNCAWCVSERVTREKLRLLKEKGIKGILISVNPFYLEWVPFSRTKRAVEIGYEIFGRNMLVYQLEYFRLFSSMGIKGTLRYSEFVKRGIEGSIGEVEFFFMGRAAYRLGGDALRYRAQELFKQGCVGGFLRTWHNHFDNYGNFIPGYCGGITLGDCRNLSGLIEEGIDTDERPVIGYLAQGDMEGLFQFAQDFGYRELPGGYLSLCHLCTEIRRHLLGKRPFLELGPQGFYDHL
jgi:hypothetical protein